MENALCIEDGIIYNAVNFALSTPEDIARKRRLLQCPECEGPAFFRNVSFNGQRIACFGARPHAQGCQLAAQDFIYEYSTDENKGQIIPSSKIIIDFRYGTTISPDSIFNAGCIPIQEGLASGYNFDQPHTHIYYRQRLSSLLRKLIESPLFCNSDQIIRIEGRGEVSARNLFMLLQSATHHFSGHFKGYWGVISDAKFALDRSLWFNSGGNDNISFCLDSKFVEGIINRYGIRDLEDISGAYILVFGISHITPNGKLWCLIDDPALMALRLTSASMQ